MNADLKRKPCYLQCQKCGTVYTSQRKILIEELFIQSNCQSCGVATALNLGDNEDDVHLYMNINMDRRIY